MWLFQELCLTGLTLTVPLQKRDISDPLVQSFYATYASIYPNLICVLKPLYNANN